MNVSAYDTFVAMYYALDAANDNIKSSSLSMFLTDADPFLFKGENSADPAIFAEFSEAFGNKFKEPPDEKASLEFVRSYLKKLNQPILVTAFDSAVDNKSWSEALKQYRSNR